MTSRDRLLELRGLLQRFRVLTKDVGPDTDVYAAVGIGRELWRFIETAQSSLEKVKQLTREQVDGTPGRHEITGPDGSLCVVVVPEPKPVMRKGLAKGVLGTLHIALGPELFGQLFRVQETIIPRKTFADDVSNLDVLKASAAMGVVDNNTGKSRVSFTKKKP